MPGSQYSHGEGADIDGAIPIPKDNSAERTNSVLLLQPHCTAQKIFLADLCLSASSIGGQMTGVFKVSAFMHGVDALPDSNPGDIQKDKVCNHGACVLC